MSISHAALLKMAKDARKSAYSPYSHFAVGAALLYADGSVYTGCNVENSAFTPPAAPSALLYKAISETLRALRL